MESSYIFITGASSGIGEAAALLLSESKHHLLLGGRDRKRLEAVADLCVANGANVETFVYDLEKVEDVSSELKKNLAAKSIKVRAFVHCAGMTELLPMSKSLYKVGLQVMKVNYFAATEIISTLLKRKINAGNLQNIIFFSSMAVEMGIRYQPHYTASKGALVALTRALALELAPAVRVNCITPGAFPTRIAQAAQAISTSGKALEWKRVLNGTLKDIANAVEFLLSEKSSFITGNNIYVNGGEHLKV